MYSKGDSQIILIIFRMSISETRSAEGLRSELVIERADRRDSGVYRCQASNPYGRSDHFVHLAVQGNTLFSLPSFVIRFHLYILVITMFFTRATRTTSEFSSLGGYIAISSASMAKTIRW